MYDMRMSGEDYAARLRWKTPHRRKGMHLPSFKLQQTQHILHIAFRRSAWALGRIAESEKDEWLPCDEAPRWSLTFLCGPFYVGF